MRDMKTNIMYKVCIIHIMQLVPCSIDVRTKNTRPGSAQMGFLMVGSWNPESSFMDILQHLIQMASPSAMHRPHISCFLPVHAIVCVSLCYCMFILSTRQTFRVLLHSPMYIDTPVTILAKKFLFHCLSLIYAL